MKKIYKYKFIALFLFFVCMNFIYAQEYESSNFKILNPVLNSAQYSTSNNFKLWSTINQDLIGTSSSSSFSSNNSFLSFPFVTTPVLSATSGNSQVSLSWIESEASLGWSVSGYSVGQSLSSGGPYTYTDVGNVLSSTRSSLSNGTTYYFVVVAKDQSSNFIATSSEVSSVPSSPSSGSGSGGSGGGGGGGGGGGSLITTASFSGKAYPKSNVTLLKDGQVSASTIAGSDGTFQIILSSLSSGNYIFSLYSEDNKGIRSSSVSFPVSVTSGSSANITGIFISPTITVDKSEVKKGENIAIFGQSAKDSSILIQVNSDEEFFIKTQSDKDGIYLYNFDTSVLEYGDHSAKSKASLDQIVSSFSSPALFKVGSKNILNDGKKKCPVKADLNNDCKVNLVDFSIAAYWYSKQLSQSFISIENTKLNNDKKLDLRDFSIMAFYWTG